VYDYPAGSELLYFDTASLQQTNSAPLTGFFTIFGVDAGTGRIYLWSGSNFIEVLDFATGQLIVSRTFAEVEYATLFLVASGSNTVDLVGTASGQVIEVPVPYAPVWWCCQAIKAVN
jgi:hypothetical protein